MWRKGEKVRGGQSDKGGSPSLLAGVFSDRLGRTTGMQGPPVGLDTEAENQLQARGSGVNHDVPHCQEPGQHIWLQGSLQTQWAKGWFPMDGSPVVWAHRHAGVLRGDSATEGPCPHYSGGGSAARSCWPGWGRLATAALGLLVGVCVPSSRARTVGSTWSTCPLPCSVLTGRAQHLPYTRAVSFGTEAVYETDFPSHQHSLSSHITISSCAHFHIYCLVHSTVALYLLSISLLWICFSRKF